jgi:hypothetical protein
MKKEEKQQEVNVEKIWNKNQKQKAAFFNKTNPSLITEFERNGI